MDRTLDYYNNNATEYVAKTVKADMSELYARFEAYLPEGAHILDLGCGSGRDTLHFLARGFKATSIDGSPAMCQAAEAIIGQSVVCCDFSEIDYENDFDGIWACASLVHVPEDQIRDVIHLIHRALKPGGMLYASFKLGLTENVDEEGRYFIKIDEDQIRELFLPEFEIIEQWTSGDKMDGRELEWVNCILKKLT